VKGGRPARSVKRRPPEKVTTSVMRVLAKLRCEQGINYEDLGETTRNGKRLEPILSAGHGSQFQWSVLRPKNLDFRYILQWSRKHALFMAEFVAEAILKCTIHKGLLFLDLRHAHWLRSRLDR
jgi:hypothetical protein